MQNFYSCRRILGRHLPRTELCISRAFFYSYCEGNIDVEGSWTVCGFRFISFINLPLHFISFHVIDSSPSLFTVGASLPILFVLITLMAINLLYPRMTMFPVSTPELITETATHLPGKKLHVEDGYTAVQRRSSQVNPSSSAFLCFTSSQRRHAAVFAFPSSALLIFNISTTGFRNQLRLSIYICSTL